MADFARILESNVKQFCDDDFLLNSETAKKLYQEIAHYPILDYHNHLNVQQLAENTKFENLTQLWLTTDHYKWRQMRTCGVSEKYITGDGTDYEKFLKFVEACELMIGNPVSQWSQLELKIYFDLDLPLITANAQKIWDLTCEKLKTMTCRTFLEKSNVYAMCSTDDPIDDLKNHQICQENWKAVKVIGNFRPDKAMKINADGFIDYIHQFEKVVGYQIPDYSTFIQALRERIEFFHQHGGRSADHGLDHFVFTLTTENQVNALFEKRMAGSKLDDQEFSQYIGRLLMDLAKTYHEKNWVMLLHTNVRRDNNLNLLAKIGSDIGCDSVGEQFLEKELNLMLRTLKMQNILPKMSIFALNENNWSAVATLVGNYQDNEEGIKGKLQLGTAWWFADTYTGNKNQILKFAELSSLGTNIGMLTDSRSFLSFARHDYYRRLLCDVVGEWSENGMCVNDWEILKKTVKAIAFDNAKVYFGY